MIYEEYLKVLYIDLSDKKIRIEQRKDLADYLGGVGVASKLLEENIKGSLDALEEVQPIVFAIGPLSFIFPVVTKTVAMFKSPLTGELGESYAGGRLALAMLHAGYDAIVITGKADKPVYISISKSDIRIKDARALWQISSEDVGRIIRERETGEGKRSIIRIGPGGENLVKFASVCVDTYRHFGRLGLGAVFGSKNLKAVSVIGDRDMPIKDLKGYFKIYNEIYERVTDTEIMSKYHDSGTPINIEPLNLTGGLPTMNLQAGSFDHAESISGEVFAEKNLVRKMACTGCPVGCIHIGQLRKVFDKGYEYESMNIGYDYELIFSLGSYLGVKSTDEILELIERVENRGIDAISTGVALGWATEAYAKKLISAEQTIVPLEFGNTANYVKAIEFLGDRENEFYRILGEGSFKASQVYGGQDFALTFGKNEMPGYHTGYGSVVGFAVSARHSHLTNAGYSVDQTMKEFDKEKLVESLFKEEKERCLTDSLIICLFARKVYDRETILKALESIGRKYTSEELDDIAEKIYKTKIRIKKACGFSQIDVKLPHRLFETPSMTGLLDEKTAYELMEMYSKKVEEMMNSTE